MEGLFVLIAIGAITYYGFKFFIAIMKGSYNSTTYEKGFRDGEAGRSRDLRTVPSNLEVTMIKDTKMEE